MKREYLAAAILLILVSGFPLAGARDAAAQGWDWNGPYVGGHVGALTGIADFVEPGEPSIFGGSATTPGFMFGAQIGYNHVFAPQWLAGVEASASYLSSQGSSTCLQSSPTIIGSICSATPRAVASFTGRLGYLTEPLGRTMIYGKGGLAWMLTDIYARPGNSHFPGYELDADSGTAPETHEHAGALGWTLGAGVEYAMSPSWSLGMEYDYYRFDNIPGVSPRTVNVQPLDNSGGGAAGAVTNIAAGTFNTTQQLHVVRLGLNYRWGAQSRAPEPEAGPPPPAAERAPGWEIEGGLRYWYSWGNFQNSNGSASGLVSRLSWNQLSGSSGEAFVRVDSPVNVFIKGFLGGGSIARGTMNDEDWALPQSFTAAASSYEVTNSSVSGSITYLTADLGYDVIRDKDHKVGLFIGYNRYFVNMSMFGCDQLVNPGSGICSTSAAPDVNGITEVDTWHSLRVGVSAELPLATRLKMTGDIAFLPYVFLDGLDIHRSRQPPLYFQQQGTGNGVQAEIMLSYGLTENLSLGAGLRYWAMWLTNGTQFNQGDEFFANVERYGVLAQAAYKF